MDGSLARRTAPAGARGPARVLALAIFFQETDEALKKKKKKISEMMAEVLTAGLYQCDWLPLTN